MSIFILCSTQVTQATAYPRQRLKTHKCTFFSQQHGVITDEVKRFIFVNMDFVKLNWVCLCFDICCCLLYG